MLIYELTKVEQNDHIGLTSRCSQVKIAIKFNDLRFTRHTTSQYWGENCGGAGSIFGPLSKGWPVKQGYMVEWSARAAHELSRIAPLQQ
jgi:hypothetical protein